MARLTGLSLAAVLLAACDKKAEPPDRAPAPLTQPATVAQPAGSPQSSPDSRLRAILDCSQVNLSFRCPAGGKAAVLASAASDEERAKLRAVAAAVSAVSQYRSMAYEFGGDGAKESRPKQKTVECEQRMQVRLKSIDDLASALDVEAKSPAAPPVVAAVRQQIQAAVPDMRACVDCVEANRARCTSARKPLDAGRDALVKEKMFEAP